MSRGPSKIPATVRRRLTAPKPPIWVRTPVAMRWCRVRDRARRHYHAAPKRERSGAGSRRGCARRPVAPAHESGGHLAGRRVGCARRRRGASGRGLRRRTPERRGRAVLPHQGQCLACSRAGRCTTTSRQAGPPFCRLAWASVVWLGMPISATRDDSRRFKAHQEVAVRGDARDGGRGGTY